MNVSLKSSEGLRREFTLEMTAGDIGKRVDARIADLAPGVKMPGFRPGKVPMSVVRSRYGKQVLGEVLQGSLDEAVRIAVDDNDLRVATSPSLSIDEYDEGKDLKATISLEVMPEIPPIDIASISLERPVVEVGEGQVDEAIAGLAEENRPTSPVAEPRAAREGDTAVIDFTGRIDGEAFEGGSAEGHSLVIGSNSFLPGFEEGLVGAMPGSTVELEVPFPEDYPAANLAGRKAGFEVAVTELREPGEIRIDDDFAKSMGMEDLAAMKAAVRERLGMQHSHAVRSRVKTSILDAFDEAAGDFEVPPTLLAREYEAVCQAMGDGAAQGDEGRDPPPAADEGMSDEDKAEADGIARRRVRLGMVLADIGRANGLQVTEEESQRAIAAEARRHPGKEKEVLGFFRGNPDAVQQLVGPVFEDKVIDFVLEMAKVEDKAVTAEELHRLEEEDIARRSAGPAKAAKGAKAGRKPARKPGGRSAQAKKGAPGKAARKASGKAAS